MKYFVGLKTAGVVKKNQMIQLSENSLRVLQHRYLRKDAAGNLIETPEQLFKRVARFVASAELKWGNEPDVVFWEEKFYNIMRELLFLPNSPTLMNAGTSISQLSACFVLPVEDSMNNIFTTLKNAALIQQSGGGTGFNFSHLRPHDDFVLSSGGTASGPLAFMKIFDVATEQIKQAGKRRGANMAILNIDHPDIEEFIFAKRAHHELNNFNISVGISDGFMHALEAAEDWPLIHPNNNIVVKRVKAKKLWDNMVESAWLSGDPGLVFLDAVNRGNPTPALGKMESTNPCGEVPLLAYEPCNLGSVNLSKMVQLKNGINTVDWHRLEEVVKAGIHFLDNVVEVNNYIIPEVKAMAMGNRKIGLGVMGWAELLILLEMPYDSLKAVELADQLMQFIQSVSTETSKELAEKRGVFLNWEKSIYFPDVRLRNATRNSIAPTGTISIIADTSPSIEPLFALAFQRQHVLNGATLSSVNALFINFLQTHQLYSKEIIEQVTRHGDAAGVNELPAAVKRIFKTALEISPYWHLMHQLAFQKYTDNAVSKTINLPEETTKEAVSEIYKMAWLKKAKGITVFRNNSKDKQVIRQGIEYEVNDCQVCLE